MVASLSCAELGTAQPQLVIIIIIIITIIIIMNDLHNSKPSTHQSRNIKLWSRNGPPELNSSAGMVYTRKKNIFHQSMKYEYDIQPSRNGMDRMPGWYTHQQ